MHKLLIFTDLHITEPGEAIIGLDPGARFAAALDHALAGHPDAEAVLLLGDLTHHGRPAQYARLEELLQTCRLPIHMTLGNHDDPEAFAARFPGQMNAGFAQHALEFGASLVLLLDTADRDGAAPRHGGWLCQTRLDWLQRALAAAPGRPHLIACHHPPFKTGFPGMDAIALANGQALYARLDAAGAQAHLLCGHVHRTISGRADGYGFSALKSPCHQMPMALNDRSTALSVDEPGAYGIVLLQSGGVIVHSEDFALARSGTDDPHSA